MNYDLERRTAEIGVGELAAFTITPRETRDRSQSGPWRAELGSQLHEDMRRRTRSESPQAEFERPVQGQIMRRNWIVTLSGRIDQYLREPGAVCIREIKSTLKALPLDEAVLRNEYPDYFAQLAAYIALERIAHPGQSIRGELVFIEPGSGLTQSLCLTRNDESLFTARLDRLLDFLTQRSAARERLRHLRFSPPFEKLREGQEHTRRQLSEAIDQYPRILFVAPTGFGKTGILLESALQNLREGRAQRIVYLTGKATGQLQVTQTLAAMTAKPGADAQSQLAAWLVRPKSEHCPDPGLCGGHSGRAHPLDIGQRWQRAGLNRFLNFPDQARDLPAIIAAGKEAGICPYEITRTALAFQDVWIGDYNYVFSAAHRRIFYEQPGWNPPDTLLVVDEAHNLASRVAEAYSHSAAAEEALAVLGELDASGCAKSFKRTWETWWRFLSQLEPCDQLDLATEEDARDLIDSVTDHLPEACLDFEELSPFASEQIRELPLLGGWFERSDCPRLAWVPSRGRLSLKCLDASALIAETLAPFGSVIFVTATPGPADCFAAACGLDAGAPLPAQNNAIHWIRAEAPWRENAYSVAYDTRVSTAFRLREQHYPVTADTVAALCEASAGRPVAVFFPSYTYAGAIRDCLSKRHPALRVVCQERKARLDAQNDWLEMALAFNDAIFFVLGSSFAEGIDTLGGRISHAMVVSPALPEANAIQRAKESALISLSRAEAFRRVYQIPGLQKVNQALGRLVRAPGQHAKVLLHCSRFIEAGYASLLAPEYQFGDTLTSESELAAWLHSAPAKTTPD